MQHFQQLTSKELLERQRSIVTPFTYTVKIDKQDHLLRVTQILRVLPGKRIVALVTHGEKELLLKLFLGVKNKKNYQKDLSGVKKIQQCDIQTPAIVACGESTDGLARYILFQYLHDSQDLSESLLNSSDEQYSIYLQQTLAIIFKGYRAGLLQADIHLGNFLFHHNTLYWIDGAEVMFTKQQSLTIRQIIDNLVLFFAQFPLHNDRYIEAALELLEKLYIIKHTRPKEKISRKEFELRLTQCRQKILLKYRNKVCRESSAFACHKRWNRFLIYHRDYKKIFPDSVINRLDQVIEAGQILKDGNTATVAKVLFNNQEYVIKRYNIKSFSHALSRLFRRSRAWHSWCNAHCLLVLGIKTAEPVLMLEKRFGPFRRQAYLITLHIDLKDLSQQVSQHQQNPSMLNKLFGLMKVILKDFRQQMISHGDLKASNILIDEDNAYIIDLDSMKFHQTLSSFTSSRQKDITRLEQNWNNKYHFDINNNHSNQVRAQRPE